MKCICGKRMEYNIYDTFNQGTCKCGISCVLRTFPKLGEIMWYDKDGNSIKNQLKVSCFNCKYYIVKPPIIKSVNQCYIPDDHHRILSYSDFGNCKLSYSNFGKCQFHECENI